MITPILTNHMDFNVMLNHKIMKFKAIINSSLAISPLTFFHKILEAIHLCDYDIVPRPLGYYSTHNKSGLIALHHSLLAPKWQTEAIFGSSSHADNVSVLLDQYTLFVSMAGFT